MWGDAMRGVRRRRSSTAPASCALRYSPPQTSGALTGRLAHRDVLAQGPCGRPAGGNALATGGHSALCRPSVRHLAVQIVTAALDFLRGYGHHTG